MRRSVITAAVLVLAGCSSAPEWEAPYRAALEAEWADLDPAETLQACTAFAAMTDAEVRATFASGAGDSVFDDVAGDLGFEPTTDDYMAAMDVAVGLINERCG